MLGDSCDTCYSPLMQPRGSTDKICVVCPTASAPPKAASTVPARNPQQAVAHTPVPPRSSINAAQAEEAWAGGPSYSSNRLTESKEDFSRIAPTRVLPAPRGWESMSQQELAQVVAGGTKQVTVPAADAPDFGRAQGNRGDTIRLASAQGNVGPLGGSAPVQVLQARWEAPEPEASMVERLERGLRLAQQEEESQDEQPAGHPQDDSATRTVNLQPQRQGGTGAGWAREILQRASKEAEEEWAAAPGPAEKGGTGVAGLSAGLLGLQRALAAELATVSRLGGTGGAEESVAAAAGRIARLVEGMKSLQTL